MSPFPRSAGENPDNPNPGPGDEISRVGKSKLVQGAPRPVDPEQIRQFHAGTLDRALELEIRDLIVSFRDWADASRDILIDGLKSNRVTEGDGKDSQMGSK